MINIYKVTRMVKEGVEGLETEMVYIGQTTETLNKKLNRHLTGQGNKAIGIDVKRFGKAVFKIDLLAQFPGIAPNNYMEEYFIKLHKDQGCQMYNIQKGGGRPSRLSLDQDALSDVRISPATLMKIERLMETTRKLYGVSFACQREDFNNKRKQTMLEKYGCEQPGMINSKLIYCFETNKVYSSVSACARELGYSQPNVSRASRGMIDNVGGMHFMMLVKNEYNKDNSIAS